jgi:hypothetical protein
VNPYEKNILQSYKSLERELKDREPEGGIPMDRTVIDKKRIEKDQDIGDSDRYSERKGTGEKKREHLSEVFNFSCVLRGEVKYLERIKEYIVQEYVDTGAVKLVKPTYEKKEIYIVTEKEWEEYQKLKRRDPGLIGPW